MVSVSLLEVRLLKKILQEQYDLDIHEYIRQLNSLQEGDVGSFSTTGLLRSCLNSLVTPEKIAQILQTEDIKAKLGEINYDPETKELVISGVKTTDVTKYLILFFITVYYVLSNKNVDDIETLFLEKAAESLKGTLHSKLLLSDEPVNIDHLNIVDKLLQSLVLAQILCYVAGIVVLVDGKEALFVKHLIHSLKGDGDIFATHVYYFLLKANRLIKNIYLEFLPDAVYNELFAAGIATVPLSVLKLKLTET